MDHSKPLSYYRVFNNNTLPFQIRPYSPAQITVTVVTLTGKQILTKCLTSDTILTLKSKITELEEIPPRVQRIVYKGRQLSDSRTLWSYGIREDANVFLVLKLGGGKDFVDLQSGKAITIDWDPDAPPWRTAMAGLNIEGNCPNLSCPANNDLVIHPHGFNTFDIHFDASTCLCPQCGTPFTPTQCALVNCRYKFHGIKSSDPSALIESTWMYIPPSANYHRFEVSVAGTVAWERLLIETEFFTTRKAGSISRDDICGICFGPLWFVEVLGSVGCGHVFCLECLKGWKGGGCPFCGQVGAVMSVEDAADDDGETGKK